MGLARTSEWLRVVELSDGLPVRVLGGRRQTSTAEISTNLVGRWSSRQAVGAAIVGVAGRDGGELQATRRRVRRDPDLDAALVTPQTEGLQALMWHLVVSHPRWRPQPAKWESVTEPAVGPASP